MRSQAKEAPLLIGGITNVPAASVVSNIWAGNPLLEILPNDGELAIGFTVSSAAGPVYGDALIDFFCGGAWEVNELAIRHTGTTKTPPIIPDDFPLSCDGLANDRIVGRVRNKHATVAVDVAWTVIFKEQM